MEALALAIKLATVAKLDLLTIDGSGGGTGMSPWNMMESWGGPSILLHSKAYEYASILAAKGHKVVDIAFAGYFDVQKKVGANAMKDIPYGAIAVWSLADKLAAGLQQLMAGAREFSVNNISRDDLYSGNRETERETSIPFITSVQDEFAKKILNL